MYTLAETCGIQVLCFANRCEVGRLTIVGVLGVLVLCPNKYKMYVILFCYMITA